MKQFMLTTSMGKRLLGKAMAAHPAVRAVMNQGTLVIVAGTTNGYVAEEILAAVGEAEDFSRVGFRRGVVVAPNDPAAVVDFAGDVVLVDGKWQKGRQVFDVADTMTAGDLILKGANAVNVCDGHAAVLVGDPQAGTAGAIVRAVAGRRVRLIVPVGLEKRVMGSIADLAAELNDPDATGPRMLALPGKVFTELDAIELLTGASARLVAAGGVHGAEGSVWLSVRGRTEQEQAAQQLVASVSNEGPCRV